ncbi:hypothetical protein GT037_005998 [Alternaria burnsii]|uniref:Uncharacterized protein n=1 Tax=Alternaria burnsii TaxID=1187904 RepID=A0A8H7EG43_9PLEO|nr:uncharacterized protein GT037_005998 [Alternaria burnsii]KAF7676493.1 hypothetical protein GT037_005998 [Alternaria burnsii]
MSGLLSTLLIVIVTENTSAPAKHNKSTLDPTRYQCHKITKIMATLRLREKPTVGGSVRLDAFLAEQSPQIILLQDSDYFEKIPAITLTSASSTSVPTMNLSTWHTFAQNEWSTTDVHITTTQSEKKKHRGNKVNCEICREDVEVNRKWLEAMEVGMTVETKDKAEMLEQDDHCEFGTMMKGLCLQASKPSRDIVMSDSWADVNT